MGQAWVVSDVLKWSGLSTSIDQDDLDREVVRPSRCAEETLAELDQYAKRIEMEDGGSH
jgi:hypothetical protein